MTASDIAIKQSDTHIIDSLKKKLAEILPAGSRAVLFGSRARGDFNSESDWDIHILIPGKEELSFDVASSYARPIEELGFDFDEFFSVMVYSYGGWEKRSFLPFYKNLENDKIILYES